MLTKKALIICGFVAAILAGFNLIWFSVGSKVQQQQEQLQLHQSLFIRIANSFISILNFMLTPNGIAYLYSKGRLK